jgi:hypothetical protein
VRDTLKYGVDSAYARDIMMSIASLSSTVVTVVLLWDLKKNRIVHWFELGLLSWELIATLPSTSNLFRLKTKTLTRRK